MNTAIAEALSTIGQSSAKAPAWGTVGQAKAQVEMIRGHMVHHASERERAISQIATIDLALKHELDPSRLQKLTASRKAAQYRIAAIDLDYLPQLRAALDEWLPRCQPRRQDGREGGAA